MPQEDLSFLNEIADDQEKDLSFLNEIADEQTDSISQPAPEPVPQNQNQINTQPREFLKGMSDPVGQMMRESEIGLLSSIGDLREKSRLRALGGMSRTPEDKLELIRRYSGDSNAKLLESGDIEYIDPNTGEIARFNEQGGFMGDVAEYSAPVANMAFNILGGVAGTIAGTYIGAPTVGGAVGSEVANQVWEKYTRDMGVPDKRNITERFVDMGASTVLDFALGKTLNPLIDLGIGATTKFFNKLRKSVFSPVEEVYDAFIDAGVSPEGAITAITDSPVIRKGLSISQGLPFAKDMVKAKELTKEQIGEKTKKILLKTGAKGASKEEIGIGIGESIDNYRDMVGGQLGAVRNKLSKSLGENKIKITNMTEGILDIVKQYQGMDKLTRRAAFPPTLTAMLEDITAKASKGSGKKNIKDFLKQDIDSLDPNISKVLDEGFNFDTLIKVRSDILKEARAEARAGNRSKERYFNQIADDLTEDITNSLKDNVSEKAANDFIRSSSKYKKRIEFIQDKLEPIQKMIKQGSGEKVFDGLISRLKKQPQSTRAMLAKLPKEARQELSRGYLDGILKKKGAADTFEVFKPESFFGKQAQNSFDINHFTKNYSSLSRDQKKAIFDNNQNLIKELDRFNALMSRIKESGASVLDSGTPAGNILIKLGTASLAAGSAGLQVATREEGERSSFLDPAMTVTGIMGGLYLNSKLMSNPKFVQILSKGLQAEDLSKVSKPFFNGLVDLARRNPSIRREVGAFINSLDLDYKTEEGRKALLPLTEKAKQNTKARKHKNQPQPQAEMLGIRG